MPRPAPLVLSRYVRAGRDVPHGLDAPVPEQPPSRTLSCVIRRAIRVSRSKDADNALNNLCFETHLADAPALSRLILRGKGINYMLIVALDYKLILLETYLPVGQSDVRYPCSPVYLIYDAVEHSITMIPSHPWSKGPKEPGVMRRTAPVTRVLIARPPGADDRSYALVNMAETTINYVRHRAHSRVEKQDVLYVWRSWSTRRWDQITTTFPSTFKGENVDHSYSAVLAFSCGGRAFWVNLLRGIMHCSLEDLLSDSTNELEFRFTSLPAELPSEISVDHMCSVERLAGMFRTMGRVGESSIKFVSIDGFMQLRDFANCTVRVWSLSPENSMTEWTERSLNLGKLVKQKEFRNAGLPIDMVPMYPGLNPEEDDVIYFMLGNYDQCCQKHSEYKGRCKAFAVTANKPRYLLRVDMRRGVLLSSARLPDQTSPSVILADTYVLPSSMIPSAVPSPMVPSAVPSPMVPCVVPSPRIQRGSTADRKGKRSHGALTS